MEYPTWGVISKKVLGQVNLINPVNVYGNTAFVPEKKTNPKCVCNNPQYTQDLVGVDIPVLLSQDNKASKGIIIILGESPLRTRNDKDNNNNIILGLPYAVHMDENNPPQSRMYKNIFNALLTKGYSIYLTDIIKDWYADRVLVPSEGDIELFESELVKLQNSHHNTNIWIVVFGQKAKDAINKISKRNATDFPKVIELPHPSKKNWTTWKLRIFKKAVYGNDINYAIKRYPNPSSPTNEDIVSNEAIDEILANIP